MKTDERGATSDQATGQSAPERVATSGIPPRGERLPACASEHGAAGSFRPFRSRSSTRRLPACWVVAWVALCWVVPAAAEPSVAEVAVARRLFREATELRQAERWELAAQKLREAIALKETPGLRFHLAHCEEKLGRLVEAQVEYDRADELIAGGAMAPDVLPLLEAARAALRERVPTLRIRLPGDPKNVRLSINDVPLSPRLIGEAVPLNPGEHRVQVDADGHVPSMFTVRLDEGEDRNLDASVGEPVAPPPRVASAPRGEASRPRKLDKGGLPAQTSGGFGVREGVLIGEGVVALAGAGLGVYFLLERGDAADRVEAATRHPDITSSDSATCQESDAPDACRELGNAVRDKQRSGEWAVGSFIGAGVGAAALVTTWLLWPEQASTRGSGRFLVVPVATATATGGGAAVVGQF